MKMKNIAAIVAAMAVSAVSVVSMSASAEMKDSYTFALGGQFGVYSDWAKTNTVTVDHDGTYTITWTVPEATETNENDLTLLLDSDVNIYDYATTEGGTGLTDGTIKVTIDSVTVDGTALAYTQSAESLGTDDLGSALRVNMRNRFASPVITDLEANWSIQSELAVTFTVEGLFPVNDPEPTEASTEEQTTAPADSTTTAAGTTTAGGTTTTAAGSTTTAVATTTNAATGDTGIAVAVAALAVAGGMVLVSRKNK